MLAYLACFDIEDDRNRRRVAKRLLTYGDRVQYSVFEITVSNKTQLQQLRTQCQKHIEKSDSLRFYALTSQGRLDSMDAWGEPIARFPAAIIL